MKTLDEANNCYYCECNTWYTNKEWKTLMEQTYDLEIPIETFNVPAYNVEVDEETKRREYPYLLSVEYSEGVTLDSNCQDYITCEFWDVEDWNEPSYER